jgi:hypothetical protein
MFQCSDMFPFFATLSRCLLAPSQAISGCGPQPVDSSFSLIHGSPNAVVSVADRIITKCHGE